MKVRVEEVSPIERKLSIEVEQSRVTNELDQAYSQLSRQVKIAGFRPGKVPRRILEQRFREQVEDDVIRKMVERAYLEAVHEYQVQPVSQPQVSNDGLRPNEPFTFQARVQVKPKIEAKDYRELPLKKADAAVSDEKVEEQVERLRQGMSRLEPVEGRDEARSGDFALVDYDATIEGKEFPGGKAENATLEVAPGEIIDSKAQALEGARVGATVELDSTLGDDYPVEQLRGKRAHFKVRLKALKAKVVPELNDDLAQEVQAGKTLAELRAKVREDLERAMAVKAAGEEREQIAQLLIERNPFEVPGAMVERASEMMLDGALRAMARRGLDPRQMNLDAGKLLEEMRPRALGEVKAALLFEAIANQEKIEVADPEIEKKIEEIARDSGQPMAKVKRHFGNPEERRTLVQKLREEKTVEFLKAGAKYL
ncbi:MAG TPA: trigger factor [Myxococcaceae bacterium]|nr:trigger factor [Myxococcaceae bacterium]